MKYLINDAKTKELLSEWRPGCEIYSHFIWNSGTKMQRSIEGLLRSLLFQILDRNRTLMDGILQNKPELSRFEYPGDWSNAELKDTLVQSITSHTQGLCIFVDGLDEIDRKESPFDLVDLVKDLASVSTGNGIKLCVSSRPEPSFNTTLKLVPSLRLQDLTFGDMKTYAKHFIENKCHFTFDTGLAAAKFSHEVAVRAEGVFLWAALAEEHTERSCKWRRRNNPAKATGCPS